jgi:hypothetical protein
VGRRSPRIDGSGGELADSGVPGGGLRWRSGQKPPARGRECFGDALWEEKVARMKKVGALGGGSCAEEEKGKGENGGLAAATWWEVGRGGGDRWPAAHGRDEVGSGRAVRAVGSNFKF